MYISKQKIFHFIQMTRIVGTEESPSRITHFCFIWVVYNIHIYNYEKPNGPHNFSGLSSFHYIEFLLFAIPVSTRIIAQLVDANLWLLLLLVQTVIMWLQGQIMSIHAHFILSVNVKDSASIFLGAELVSYLPHDNGWVRRKFFL